MRLTLTPSFELSDEHAASSYGQPVLVNTHTHEAYGQHDVLEPYPSWSYMPAYLAARRMVSVGKFTDEQRAFIALFTGNSGRAA